MVVTVEGAITEEDMTGATVEVEEAATANTLGAQRQGGAVAKKNATEVNACTFETFRTRFPTIAVSSSGQRGRIEASSCYTGSET
ncbi:hypothetical protein HDV00_008253, partial [Rhizophlyctis rosea]